ncbi:MAG: inositol monophosphatase [Deltaproteobacteria bacterium]|nr:inositol monophosphatase [Deltaproteobacteria bacterium]
MPMEPMAPEWDQMLKFAEEIARKGGAIALNHYGKADPQLKYDMSLVTSADIEVQSFLENEITGAYPHHAFFGEESGTGAIRDAEHLWVVDPVDGTAAFSSQLPVWGISISHFYEGELKFGVFYMPATDEFYSGMGKKALFNGKPVRARLDDQVDNESVLLTYSRFHQDFTTNFPGKIRSMGSSVAHIAYVARGAAWGALLGRVHIWDIAPGMAVLKAAGGEIRDLDGNLFNPADYMDGRSVDRIFLAAAKGQHDQIARLLTAK